MNSLRNLPAALVCSYVQRPCGWLHTLLMITNEFVLVVGVMPARMLSASSAAAANAPRDPLADDICKLAAQEHFNGHLDIARACTRLCVGMTSTNL